MTVYGGRAFLLIVVLAIVATNGGGLIVPRDADACPAEVESFRNNAMHGQQLPDCRAYEQVSPIDKNTTDADGRSGHVQSSASGESVTYYSVVPFPAIPGASEFPTYLSTRSRSGWSTQGLLPLVEPGAESGVLGLTEDNEDVIVYTTPEENLLLAPGAQPGRENTYVYNVFLKEYRLLTGRDRVAFADATPNGSYILFTNRAYELIHGLVNETGAPYLYEWAKESGRVTFVGEVEGKVPAEGTVAGSNENEGIETYDQNTISENGSRIFFSERGGGKKIYMREPNANRTVDVSIGEAQWKAATPDGSKVFYTEHGNLYEFEPEGLTREEITVGSPNVMGLVGISQNGSYAYFVAEGVIPSEYEAGATVGEPNLYEWHQGAASPIRFIATLNRFGDESDWRGFVQNEEGASAEGYIASRISPDGTKALISSRAKLTEYANAGHNEIYLYNATESLSKVNPRCISCNPTGATATKDTFLSSSSLKGPVAGNAFMTRNLSIEGTRVFFQTEEALLPEANTQMNVYEWEHEGTGSCVIGKSDESGGCLFLVSTGQSTSASYFGDASATGSDIFFFTRQSLVAQDRDDNVDVYDARVNGGLTSQNAGSPSECSGEGCRGAPGLTPIFGAPSSLTLSGIGDFVPVKESVTVVKSKSKEHAGAEKLTNALRVCNKKPAKERARCRARAQKKYDSRAKKGRGKD
jgi:hypothetical protein